MHILASGNSVNAMMPDRIASTGGIVIMAEGNLHRKISLIGVRRTAFWVVDVPGGLAGQAQQVSRGPLC